MARLYVEGEAFVVKRYNIKSRPHAIGRMWRPTRAQRAWQNAHRLRMLGIPTFQPIALIERRVGPFRRDAYLVMRDIGGVDLRERFANKHIRVLVGLFADLAQGRPGARRCEGHEFRRRGRRNPPDRSRRDAGAANDVGFASRHCARPRALHCELARQRDDPRRADARVRYAEPARVSAYCARHTACRERHAGCSERHTASAMIILGLSGALNHDASAALLIDGEIVAAAEEERFIRDKHAKNRMPLNAARFCLQFASIEARDVDVVAFPYAPIGLDTPARWHYAKRHWYAPDRALDALFNGNRRYRRNRGRVLIMGTALGIDWTRTEFVPVEHHLAHASSAYHLSGFEERTAILGVDGKGEYATTFFGYGEGGRITRSRNCTIQIRFRVCTER